MRAARLKWLSWIVEAVRRHVDRHGHRMVQASGTLNNLYVSLDEAKALLDSPERSASPDAAAAAFAAFVAGEASDEAAPWTRLQARFRLSDAELRLLLLAAAPALSVDLARLYTFAWADFAIKRPSVGFLCELAADAPEDAPALMAAFVPEARLVRHRLIEVRDEPAWGSPTPRLHRGVVVVDAVHFRPLLELLGPPLARRGARDGPVVLRSD